MLKDSLKQLIQNQDGRPRECKLGKIIVSQDEETAKLMVEVLSSEASTMGIIRTLSAEGIHLSREYLGEKRATCFKGKESAGKCCLDGTVSEDFDGK